MASELITHVSDATFQADVLDAKAPVLVDFWAEWCGPCKMIAPVLEELADEFEGRVKIGKVDVDENQALSVQYGISAIPTLLFFKGGQVVDQVRGARSKRDLKESLDRLAG